MSDRHEKWQPVEPGHVIPAGQPFRVEYPASCEWAVEYAPSDHDKVAGLPLDGSPIEWFIDSSWRPPLELPTEAVSWDEIPETYEVGDGERVRCEFNDAHDEAIELTADEDMAGVEVRHLFRGWSATRKFYTVRAAV